MVIFSDFYGLKLLFVNQVNRFLDVKASSFIINLKTGFESVPQNVRKRNSVKTRNCAATVMSSQSSQSDLLLLKICAKPFRAKRLMQMG